MHLYGGNEQNKRYYTCLKKALAEIPAHIDLGCSRSDIGTHIYAGKVICALVDIAVEMGVIEGEDSITLLNGTSVFDFAFPILIETLYAPDIPTRPEDIVVTTLYNRMKRYHENR